jgi:hypothetical protein
LIRLVEVSEHEGNSAIAAREGSIK